MPRTTKTTKKVEKKENKETTPKKAHRPKALTVRRAAAAKKTTKKGGKRAPTPYFIFTNEKREEVKANIKEGENINKRLAEMWKGMSEEEKKVYQDKYKEAADAIKAEQEKVNQNRKEKLAASRAAAKEKKE